MKAKNWGIIFLAALMFAFSCKKPEPKPKPFGYLRITFPEHKYQKFDTSYPYTFEYPVYAKIEPDPEAEEPYWINVVFPKYRAEIHITYHRIHDNLDTMLDDSHILVYKHTVKADNISAKDFINDTLKVYATLFVLEGNAATPYQFHITDSVKNFLRGSFYFNLRPSYDSLYPYIQFFGQDIRHLIETFKWK